LVILYFLIIFNALKITYPIRPIEIATPKIPLLPIQKEKGIYLFPRSKTCPNYHTDYNKYTAQNSHKKLPYHHFYKYFCLHLIKAPHTNI
ncbi:MAG: hypothetical protein K2H53_05030, partial [Clostridia bacterium]|nr:hypothetical protein [Clostridia bacterium]